MASPFRTIMCDTELMYFKPALHNARGMERLLSWDPQMVSIPLSTNAISKILEVFLTACSAYFFWGEVDLKLSG